MLSYEGSNSNAPNSAVGYNEAERQGTVLNPMDIDLRNKQPLSFVNVDGIDPSNNQNPIASGRVDRTLYLEYGFNPVNSYHQHRPGYLNNQLPDNDTHFPPQVNGISLKLKSNPLLISGITNEFCTPDLLSNRGVDCTRQFCECQHVIQLPVNTMVEIVMVDKGGFPATHPFHLHGHGFYVVGMGGGPTGFNLDQFQSMDRRGMVTRKLRNAVLKDTVGLQSPGYTIIRVFFDNPGYWLFHCHIDSHLSQGMGVVFKIGEDNQIRRGIPQGFPQCPDFMPFLDDDDNNIVFERK